MPCLHSEALESMESGSMTPGASSDAGAGSVRREIVSDPPMLQSTGWFFSPLWSPRCRTRSRKFGDGTRNYQEEAWLDDHSDFTKAYFLRRASAASCPQTEMSSLMSRFPRSSSDHSDLLMKAPYRRNSSPLKSPDLNISTLTDRLKPLASNLSVPEWMDHLNPDVKDSLSPCSPCLPRCSHFQFSPCQQPSYICPCSPNVHHSPQFLLPTATNAITCGHGDGCPWMTGLLGEGLRWVDSLAELCQGAVIHAGELLGAEGGSLSLVRKDCGGRSNLEEVIALTSLGQLNEGSLYSHAHLELVKGIMGCVLATGSPINLRDASEDPRFNSDSDQASKIRTVLSVPISNHRGEVVGVLVMINKKNDCDGSLSVFTNMDEKVLSNHMDVLGMVLDNVQLYESARQEAKRSQALIEMAQVLSKEHHSFEVMVSKMAATIMPFTRAQYCTIFIPSEQTSDTKQKISFSRVIHLECEELGSTCQIYRREHDIRDIDPSYAFRTLTSMETLNMSKSSEESKRSLICCPVRNERSENVIAVCQLMNKQSRDSDEMEPFNRYDERLLEDLAVYCGLALQYAQAVQITEERRASIEVTQEVLAYHITAAEQEIQALQEATIPSAESLHILDFHFSGFGLPEDVTTQATIRMFLDLNLVQDFNIDYKSLCQWVLTVKRGYRNNVPYHNWHHAVSTAQSMFAMLMSTGQLQNIFSRLEILALMIATLNHDVDHRGVNNSFIERTHQPLAQLYGHSSLENHHYNLCVFILNNTGSQILSGLSAEEHKALLHIIKRAILATDLTVYMERRREFFSLTKKSGVSWKSEKQRDLLRSMLMTASDLSAITKPWPEQKRIASLVAMEFFAQGDKEREEFKIKPIDIMNRENSTRLPYMQVEYIDEVCYPLYKTVSRLFDSCSPLLNGCKKNRENWLQLADEQEKENNENSIIALATHEDIKGETQTED
ncbi:cGMP-specific 3',5'-cyclic phosphodiesterase [Archocentrus centrarchus]|uniref:cGMP-specific 3',5'-cyclic phosphodiesterase n=1 Tax=Archocentrus centrarchus TaxID=63155 RepID=UPI0011E9C8B5|nr:cGMP-specific 3',5'-cyclic phosphodiesterase-like [Archocentrus centrarchus]